jgi:RNA polymerase sigma-70 factor (ECF subfamily)
MIEDMLLIWKFRSGDSAALAKIYEEHRQNLLRIATGLLRQTSVAEDIVHDVFVQLAQSPQTLGLTGNLRSFLTTCVVNRARDANKATRQRQTTGSEGSGRPADDGPAPERWIIESERLTKLKRALAQLPYEQREAVVLHLQGGLKFRHIAASQGISINTAMSRYRYGLGKLRSLLNGEV